MAIKRRAVPPIDYQYRALQGRRRRRRRPSSASPLPTAILLTDATSQGKVYWRKVLIAGRNRCSAATVNCSTCWKAMIARRRMIRVSLPVDYLAMATGRTAEDDARRHKAAATADIIAINNSAGGTGLVDGGVNKKGDELVLSTARGMAIRFKESDARSMGRASSGVKGIRLTKDDQVVGMVVADPDATLLTACANGYGKRTPFGPNLPFEVGEIEAIEGESGGAAPPDDEAEEQDTPEPGLARKETDEA